MIKSLQIRNYAIIEELEIAFSPGLTIITGETGAGKSILLGALHLIMGGRADSKTLYRPDEKCSVEGHFDISAYDLRAFFEKYDLDYDAHLIVRREITPSGKSRAFVNDTPTNLKVLQELSSTLVDLHQQFDTLHINSSDFQRQMLDALAGNLTEVKAYQGRYREFLQIKARLRDLQSRSGSAAREIEFLQFQLNEFSEAELVANEQEKLETDLSRLTNADDIRQVAAHAFRFLLEDEPSIVGQLEVVGSSLQQLAKADERIKQVYERFEGLTIELQDVGNELEAIAEQTEADPERASIVQERLDMIYRLQQKHSVNSVAELLEVQDKLQEQLNDFEDLTGSLARLEKEADTLEKELRKRALILRKGRSQIAPDFAKKVQALLYNLAMPNARIEVEMKDLSDPGPAGMDEIQFLFSANRGGSLQTIKNVASGGEMSRLALATKSLVATAMALPSLIFDEIDSGISGDVARQMGGILRQLSNEHQVIVITHSAQVASRADLHYFVYKTDKEAEDRTITKVRLLKEEERVRAIATMLSQSPPSESAMENARELIAG